MKKKKGVTTRFEKERREREDDKGNINLVYLELI